MSVICTSIIHVRITYEVNFLKLHQNIITAHAQIIHVQNEFTRRNRFNVRIATGVK